MMKFHLLGAALGTAVLSAATIAPAQALPWQYSIDNFNDGVSSGVVGSNATPGFEFFNIAVAEDADFVTIALNANLPITGKNHIEWGDLFLNFSGKDYETAFADGDMYAIHFIGGVGDSSAASNGLYKVNSGKAVGRANSNSGFWTLQDHKNKIDNATNSQAEKGTANAAEEAVGDLDYANYFDMNARLKNVMLDGDKIGDINFLNGTQLASAGLDFAAQGATGAHTIGFSFAKDDIVLPEEFAGNPLIATIFAECNNDGMGIETDLAMKYDEPESVPEPASALGLLAIAGSAMGLRRRR